MEIYQIKAVNGFACRMVPAHSVAFGREAIKIGYSVLFSPGVRVATRPVDFRRGADGLAAIVQTVLRHDPFSGTIYVFRCKRADRVKLLVWDGSGLVLLWKGWRAAFSAGRR